MSNPFRLFFPMAWLMALWGVGLWLLFAMDLVGYPVFAHPQTMIGGFLIGHIVGFLLTAGPRFTGTSLSVSRVELACTLLPYTALCLSAALGSRSEFFYSLTALMLALIVILGARFMRRTKRPPDQFIFLPVGLVMAFLASLMGALGVENEGVRLILYEAFVLSLVLGVGSRLVPAMLGGRVGVLASMRKILTYLFLFWLSYGIEIFWKEWGPAVRVLRGALVLFMMAVEWEIARPPASNTKQALSLWISTWMMGLGLFLSAYGPWRVHALHVFYIGGLGLLTLMIATRVLLAHGSQHMLLERVSPVLLPVGLVLPIAAVLRSLGGPMPEFQWIWLYLPALLWILMVLIWGLLFLPEGLKKS